MGDVLESAEGGGRGGEGGGGGDVKTKHYRAPSSFASVGIDRGKLMITGEQLVGTLGRMRMGEERGMERAKRDPPPSLNLRGRGLGRRM